MFSFVGLGCNGVIEVIELMMLVQDIFDVQGRMWWLMWLLPNRLPKRGIGVP